MTGELVARVVGGVPSDGKYRKLKPKAKTSAASRKFKTIAGLIEKTLGCKSKLTVSKLTGVMKQIRKLIGKVAYPSDEPHQLSVIRYVASGGSWIGQAVK